MLFLKILAVIVIIILLICQIRAGADISYVDGELKVSAKVCGLLIQLYPKKEPKKAKEPKEEKPKEEKPAKEKPEKQKKEKPEKPFKLPVNFGMQDINAILRKLKKSVHRLMKGFHVDKFHLNWIMAGDDPYTTARIFGVGNAVLSALAGVFAGVKCPDTDVSTDIDFTSDEMKLDFATAIVFRLGAALDMLNTVLFGLIGVFIANKFRLFREKLFDRDAYLDEMDRYNAINDFLAPIVEKSRAKKKQKAAEEQPGGETPPDGPGNGGTAEAPVNAA